MYVTASDTNTHATLAGDRNGGVVKAPPKQVAARDVPAVQPVAATHAVVSQPAILQRSDVIVLSCIVGCVYFGISDILYFNFLHALPAMRCGCSQPAIK